MAAEDLQNEASLESKADAFKDPKSIHTYWTNAIALSSKEEEDWRDAADSACKIYRSDKAKSAAFNILFSNTETLLPAVYSSLPIPDVRPRHNDKDEAARLAAQLIERALSVQLDQYDADDVLRATVLDMVLPGRGVARVRYQPYTGDADATGGERVVWEEAVCEPVPWRSFRRGPATTWAKVPWVAFEIYPTRDELVQLAGSDIGGEVGLDAGPEGMEDKSDREKRVFKTAKVWEVWDRESRKVYFIAPSFTEGPIHVADDPLGLVDFFPTPRPLQAISGTDMLTPVTPYEVYRKQADELSEISQRLLKLYKVLKFRGIRAAEIPELDKLEELDDGEFAPSKGALAAMGGKNSLSDAIWVMPLAELVQVVRELVAQREAIKAAIYEITGIADVLRGASDPRETAAAQQIKTQWGSLRVQRMQSEVQRYCRDLFRLKAEIIANKFGAQTLALIGQGAPPQAVGMLLRQPVQRLYRIDIETDSTIRGDLTRAMQQMTQFLQGTAQYAQAVGPLVAQGFVPQQMALEVYGAFARNFKLGKQVEDLLAKFSEQAGQQPPDPQKQQQKALDMAGRQAGVQKVQAEAQKVQADTAETMARTQAQRVETAAVAAGVQMPQGFVQ